MLSSRIITLTLAVALILSAVPTGALAQEAGPSPQNETAAQETEYLQEIDPTLRLVDWDYDGSTFYLTLESDISTRLTATEAVQFEEGTGQMTIERHNVPRGTTTITVNVEPRNGEAGLVLTTPTSINNGSGTYISTGQSSSNPFASTSSTAGWLGGAATVGCMFIAVAWRELRKEPSAPEVIE